jgi:FkbM family methyltransferase
MLGQNFHRAVDAIDSLVPAGVKRQVKRLLPGVERGIYKLLRSATSADVEMVRVKRGPLKGRSFCCSMRDERDYWLGIHEPGVQSALAAALAPGAVFFDVGVHKGFFSLLGATSVGDSGLVVGFEPNPENRKWITRNLALNPDLSKRIVLEPNAVSDRTGTGSFIGSPGSATGRLVVPGQLPDEEETNESLVDTVSIDDFVDAHRRPPSVIKMDIEGGETDALKGMVRTLTEHRPVLIIEIHDAHAARALADVVVRHHYECRDFQGHSVPPDRIFDGRDQFVVTPSALK